MTTVARIIAVVIVVKGIGLLIFPGKLKRAAENFKKMKNSMKRWMGLLCTITGFILFYLTRVHLEIPMVHWIIAVFGILMILEGFFLLTLPSMVGKVGVWFYEEKGPTSIIGLILVIGSLMLYILL